MKFVINRCFGGFGLSEAAYERLIELGMPCQPIEKFTSTGPPLCIIYRDDRASFGRRYYSDWINMNRSYPLLVAVVEELGEHANGMGAELKVVEVEVPLPEVEEYHDGYERVVCHGGTWDG